MTAKLSDLFIVKLVVPPYYEKDPEFRSELSRGSRVGLLAAGILAVFGPLIVILNHRFVSGKTLVWYYRPGSQEIAGLWDKIIIMSLGLLCVILSRTTRLDIRWLRILAFLLLLAVCILSIWDDILFRDISQSVAYPTLTILVGVAALPFRPWQALLLGGSVMGGYMGLMRFHPQVAAFTPIQYDYYSLGLLMIASLCSMFLAGFLYNARYRQYRARQKEKAMRQEVTEYARELERKNVEIQEAQAQLIQSEKMAALGNLVAGIAHEVNTPLGSIKSNANTSLRALGVVSGIFSSGADIVIPQEQKNKALKALELLADLHSLTMAGVARIEKIIKALRSFAHLDEAEYQEADINEGIENTITLLTVNPEFKLKIEKDLFPLPKIYCRPSQLNQVFMNLLTNAIQAVGDEGTIGVKTRIEEGFILIHITDDGVGIPEDDLDHIFDPGFTTRGVGVGTGLGLAICYRNISEHQGTIGVESEVGKGTTVTIRLPLAPGDAVQNS